MDLTLKTGEIPYVCICIVVSLIEVSKVAL